MVVNPLLLIIDLLCLDCFRCVFIVIIFEGLKHIVLLTKEDNSLWFSLTSV